MMTTLPDAAAPSNAWIWAALALGLIGFVATATATLNLVLA